MKFRKCFSLLVLALFVFSACTAYGAGNTNDLAYIGIDELETASSANTTDGVVVTRDSVPYQGLTIADIVGSDQDGGGVSTISGFRREVELHNTTDMTAVLATESGKTFIATENTKFQLPAASAGLVYTFITSGTAEVEIQVATTPNTIKLAGPGDGDGSQGVIETGINTTGNTVTLVSDGTSWYASVEPLSAGAWVDGGAWTQLDLGAQ